MHVILKMQLSLIAFVIPLLFKLTTIYLIERNTQKHKKKKRTTLLDCKGHCLFPQFSNAKKKTSLTSRCSKGSGTSKLLKPAETNNVQLFLLWTSTNSLRTSYRFIQPIFLRIFRCIGAFIKGNGCDVSWSAVICMGYSWPRAQSFSPNLTSFYSISYMAKFCAEESSK